MAGGKGRRLDPFTRILPKPLIPFGNDPIVKIIMDNFNKFKVNNFLPYLIVGIFLWDFTHQSGIHATSQEPIRNTCETGYRRCDHQSRNCCS